MAKFEPISENDTKELRKELGLPITKDLRYMKHANGDLYDAFNVKDYEVVEQYQPSGMHSLKVILESGEEIRILAPFFAHMQKPSFVEDMLSGKDA